MQDGVVPLVIVKVPTAAPPIMPVTFVIVVSDEATTSTKTVDELGMGVLVGETKTNCIAGGNGNWTLMTSCVTCPSLPY